MSVLVVLHGNYNPSGSTQLQDYQNQARPLIAKHGGQVIVRGTGLGVLVGPRKWQIAIILRFPTEAAAEAWHNDPAYQRIIPLRSAGYSELEINMFQE